MRMCRRESLVVMVAVMLYATIDRQVFGLVAAEMSNTLHLSNTQLGLIQGLGFAAFTFIAAYPIAWVADRFDRRRLLIATQLSAAVRALPPARRARVRVLAVSVDPHGDTPPAVRRFIRQRNLVPQFRYLTGTKAQLAPVWQAWNVLVEARNLERVEHSAFVWLVDRRGITRVSYPSSVAGAVVAHDLRILD